MPYVRSGFRVLVASLVAVASTVAARPVAAVDGHGEGPLVDLGTPMESVDVGQSAAGTDLDGDPLLYATSSGHPPTFNVIEARTGEVRFQQAMEGDEFLGGPIVATPDGVTYFNLRSGSRTIVYRYSVADNTVSEVTRGCGSGCPIDKAILRGLVVGDDGTLYLAAYPDSRVFGVDPETGDVRDYGTMDSQAAYTWGITIDGDQLFVGTGNGPGLGRVYQVDVETGAKKQIPLPPGSQETTVIGDLQVVDGVLLVPMNKGGDGLGFYDIAAEEWICAGVAPGLPGPTDSLTEYPVDGKVYIRVGPEVYAVEPASCAVTPLGIADTGIDATELRGLELVPAGPSDDPASYLLSAFRNDGSYVVFDPDTMHLEDHPSVVLPSIVTTHSLGLGPDGNVYVGAYLSPYVMARVDPATDEVEVVEGPEQSDTIATVGDHIVVGSYPNAVFHAGAAGAPWDWGTAPRKIFDGVEGHQDRIFEIVDADGVGVAGTVPKYGELGGALITFDPASGDHTVRRNIVPDQSVVALAYRDGKVYGGTTIHGGLSSTPSTDEAHLFVYDLASGTRERLLVPVPGSETVSTLAFGEDDKVLWGVTFDNVLFRYQIAANKVTHRIDLGLPQKGANWGRVPTLKYRPQDGLLYGVAGHTFFSFDPETQEMDVISDAAPFATLEITEAGKIYLISDTNLYTYTPSGS